jgi:oligogalacturonide lyase
MIAVDAAPAQAGKRFSSEKKSAADAVTGVPLTLLTIGPSSDAKIYQDHPQCTADGRWIIFRTGERGSGPQAYAVN